MLTNDQEYLQISFEEGCDHEPTLETFWLLVNMNSNLIENTRLNFHKLPKQCENTLYIFIQILKNTFMLLTVDMMYQHLKPRSYPSVELLFDMVGFKLEGCFSLMFWTFKEDPRRQDETQEAERVMAKLLERWTSDSK